MESLLNLYNKIQDVLNHITNHSFVWIEEEGMVWSNHWLHLHGQCYFNPIKRMQNRNSGLTALMDPALINELACSKHLFRTQPYFCDMSKVVLPTVKCLICRVKEGFIFFLTFEKILFFHQRKMMMMDPRHAMGTLFVSF